MGAQAITPAERDLAIAELTGSHREFADAVAGLSATQWNFKPDENTWSVAECVEHVTIAEERMFLVLERCLKAPESKPDLTDELIRKAGVNRTRKFQAPERLRPAHGSVEPGEWVERLARSRARLVAYVRETQDDLRGHCAEHPILKNLDAYQWILLAAAHCRRHTAQLNEVKAAPGFPRK